MLYLNAQFPQKDKKKCSHGLFLYKSNSQLINVKEKKNTSDELRLQRN